MKRLFLFVLSFLLAAALICGCSDSNNSTDRDKSESGTVQSDREVITNVSDVVSADDLRINDVVFGRIPLILQVSGNMEYVADMSKKSIQYLYDKTEPGEIYTDPSLETALKYGDNDDLFALSIIGFEADSTREDMKFVPADTLKTSLAADVICPDFDFAGIENGPEAVVCIKVGDYQMLSCPDNMRIVCGLAYFGDIIEPESSEFENVLYSLSPDETVPVYVYASKPASSVSVSGSVISGGDIDFEEYYKPGSDEFVQSLKDGSIIAELSKAASRAGVSDNAVFSPSLGRFQADMNAEQIQSIIEDYRVEIRLFS